MPPCPPFTGARIAYYATSAWPGAASLIPLSDYEASHMRLYSVGEPRLRGPDQRLPFGQIVRRRGRQEAGVCRQASKVLPANEGVRAKRLRRDDEGHEIPRVRQERKRH